jgi:aryl-alcohol dehydrogenase-like predicted oxidoreductase
MSMRNWRCANPAALRQHRIPGMRKPKHVEQNLGVSDGRPLPAQLMDELKTHRWDRWIDIP